MTNQDVPTQTTNQSKRGDSLLGTEVTEKCIEITERFRAGSITKVSAILELQGIIPQSADTTY
jgi:hypothetical protein